MSVHYQAVLWNRQKRIYDSLVLAGIVLYLGAFVGVGALVHPAATAETLLIRGFGTLALLLLHIILAIGPLTRLDRRFLPLLYNRRHLGVGMFLCALAHGVFSTVQFHALGDVNPLVSLLSSPSGFPQLGFAALLILYLMASTSHDFWLKNLTAPLWKRMHMLVYLAYTLIVAHVLFGALQSERSVVLAAVLGAGMTVVVGLHWMASARTEPEAQPGADGFVEVCEFARIPEKRAVIVKLGGERVAVFRHDGKVSALSNVCQHQNGPLGEGRIVDGCVTCPWHGYQYLPETGASPAPFKEKVPTFDARVANGKVYVHPCPRR
jgi:nitrite reductase/ring-hydroxylating ferredoxin subunit/DMSO/TMAO reductase YedYZ heme-binding membrane subunit